MGDYTVLESMHLSEPHCGQHPVPSAAGHSTAGPQENPGRGHQEGVPSCAEKRLLSLSLLPTFPIFSPMVVGRRRVGTL